MFWAPAGLGKVIADPDLAIAERVCLTGGGACIPGMVDRIAVGTMLNVSPARDPLHAVIEGAARMLGGIDRIPCAGGETWLSQ